MKTRASREKPRLLQQATVAGVLAGAAVLAMLLGAPHAQAVADNADTAAPQSADAPKTFSLDKKFKGKLPITDLTEDEAIMHAMNRLAYGPRPGDVEYVRKLGLEKWIEQQLQPNSIDDSALDMRLQRYPTIAMSSPRTDARRFKASAAPRGSCVTVSVAYPACWSRRAKTRLGADAAAAFGSRITTPGTPAAGGTLWLRAGTAAAPTASSTVADAQAVRRILTRQL